MPHPSSYSSDISLSYSRINLLTSGRNQRFLNPRFLNPRFFKSYRQLHFCDLGIKCDVVDQLLLAAIRQNLIVIFFEYLPDFFIEVGIKIIFLSGSYKFQKQDGSFPLIFESISDDVRSSLFHIAVIKASTSPASMVLSNLDTTPSSSLITYT